MVSESQLDRIERILEGHSHRFGTLEERIDLLAISTQRGFTWVAEHFAKVDQRFSAMDKRFDGVDKRLDGIDHRLGRIETRVEDLETETRLSRNQTERRLATLEARPD